MQVKDIMSTEVWCCHPEETLRDAAFRMRDHDCGCLPVIDPRKELVGVITDRDICLCAAVRGEPLQTLKVSDALTWQPLACRPEDNIETAEDLLRDHQVRRLPVIDEKGDLKGMLSLADLALASADGKGKVPQIHRELLATTVAAISRPRSEAVGGR